MRCITYLFLVVLFILGLIFAGLNADLVSVNYYFGTKQVALSLLTLLSFVLGGLLGLLTAFITYIKLKYANRRLRHRLNLVEKELSNLRALPFKDQH
jgi:lipopolysaccharide assembly protein A